MTKRVSISERNLERIKAFLMKKLEGQPENEVWDRKLDIVLLGDRSPSYTFDEALDELLTEVGF